MASISKSVTSSARFLYKAKSPCFLLRKAMGECGSSNTGSKGSGTDGDEPGLLSPNSGSSNPSAPTIYDSRKINHNLSADNGEPCFDPLPDVPTGVFRCTTGEILGRGAGKCNYYRNPEYFSFHHMSFYDMNIALRKYRNPCPKSGRKP